MEKCKKCRYFNEIESFCNNYIIPITGPVSCEGFSSNTNIDLTTFSEDEKAACLELVEKMRAEKKRAAEIEMAKARILIEVNEALDKIGIEETKKIIRQINRDFRDMPLEED